MYSSSSNLCILTARLSGGANSAAQASWLDFGRGGEGERGGESEREGRKVGAEKEKNGWEERGRA